MSCEFVVDVGVGQMELYELDQVDTQILENRSDRILFVTHYSQKDENGIVDQFVLGT